MNAYEKTNIIDRIAADLDAWSGHLAYFSTCNGGSPDSKNVDICEAKIAKLNSDLERYSF